LQEEGRREVEGKVLNLEALVERKKAFPKEEKVEKRGGH